MGHTSPGRFWAKRMATADKGKCNNLMHFVCLAREARASFAKFKLSKPATLDVGRGHKSRGLNCECCDYLSLTVTLRLPPLFLMSAERARAAVELVPAD